MTETTPHVVIVGGGFGGLTAAQALAGEAVRVTLVDRTNHHLFQPLLYQVATAALSPAEIATPIRSVLAKQRNARVLMAEVTAVDLARKVVTLRDGELSYDFVILATGAGNFYFGHDEWEAFAPGLKTLEDAVEIRRRILLAFERAERETDAARRARLLTFCVIGGGATGVELAGSISELARSVLARDFRAIDPKQTRVILLEGGDRVLPAFTPDLSASAERQLAQIGVEVRKRARVTRIDGEGVWLGEELVGAATVLWGAGVRATPLGASLGVPVDAQGRVKIEPDCSLPEHPEAFAIGDMAVLLDESGAPLPGTSPVAMQQARHVANLIRGSRAFSAARAGERATRAPFVYVDKGAMATIGRSRAIARTGNLRLSGFAAWLAWLLVHIWYLIGFESRVLVMLRWWWSYVTFRRGARLITDPIERGPHRPR
jgi:NADH dehydrogenase